MKPGRTGLTRLLHATRYSWRGIRATFRNEAAFRQELLLCAALGATSFWLARTPLEWLLLVMPLFLLLMVELLNSAIENTVDRIGDELHDLSGRAKDAGSAAVLLALLLIATTWGSVAWDRYGG